jgi:triphosphatase
MTTEIELKYQLPEDIDCNNTLVAEISSMLNARRIPFEMERNQLINDYYDNETLDLRKIDFGLRTRSKGHQYEQTIKTAGEVIGGMHKRPEYNVELKNRQLSLSLFPKEIWPEQIDISGLQQSLKVIFSTNFVRQTWLIAQGENIIELALDQGEICTSSGKPSLVINEIEIELVKGNEKALFELASYLREIIAMEPSNLSKAARGYGLYYDEVKKNLIK